MKDIAFEIKYSNLYQTDMDYMHIHVHSKNVIRLARHLTNIFGISCQPLNDVVLVRLRDPRIEDGDVENIKEEASTFIHRVNLRVV